MFTKSNMNDFIYHDEEKINFNTNSKNVVT